MIKTVPVTIELPQPLYDELIRYASESDRTLNDILILGISLYLLQNGSCKPPESSRSYRLAARYYLDTFFRKVAA